MEPQYPLPHPLPAFVVLRKTVDEEQDVAYLFSLEILSVSVLILVSPIVFLRIDVCFFDKG